MEKQPNNSENIESTCIKEAFNHFGKLGPLLATSTFQAILNNNGNLSLGILEAAIALLVKTRIGFDINFYGGDNRTAPSASLIIYITPTVQITFIFNF